MTTYQQLTYGHFLNSTHSFIPLSDMATVVSGIFMRSGDVFILDNFKQVPDASLGFSRRISQNVRIEPDIAMPLIESNTDIAFLSPNKADIERGLVFIEAKSYSRSHQAPSDYFISQHPKLADYVRLCNTLANDNYDSKQSLSYNVFSGKQTDILLQPKHIVSVKEKTCQSFFDCDGKYAIPTGMYGVSAVSSSCISDKALTAILNSRLFSYLRYHEEKTQKHNRYARYDSIVQFPIPSGIVDRSLIVSLETLSDCLTELKQKAQDTKRQQIRKCMQQIMEMIVFEIYFSDYMQCTGLSIIESLKGSILTERNNNSLYTSDEIYSWYQTPSNTIRQKIMLLDSRSPELLYPIFMQKTK